ncbi:MAG: tetratricopeptide repeat protein [Polyangiaceae bacterium]|nr:tetratricopeptide repeat protein [Polyangiaceae bacterium]
MTQALPQRRLERPQPPAAAPTEGGPSDAPRLRLSAARGTLGLELDEPFVARPVRLVALTLTFPNIRFPIDLTGGVTRFRHRRGALARLVVDVSASELASWVAPKLRGLLGAGTPEVWLAPMEGGFAVGLADGEAALAFDVLIVPRASGVTLTTERARGIGLGGGPPQALALRALAAALRGVSTIQGGCVHIADAAARVLCDVLPAAGARAPATSGVVWDVPRAAGDRLELEAQMDVPPAALPDRLVRAAETLLLAAEADDAAYRGDFDSARDAYLSALERAPRHPEISERLAWLDTVAGERAEAALSTLIDVTPAVDAGLLGAELLAAVGDVEGARGALARAARAEPFSPLAARAWMRGAALADEVRERRAALDEAVARAPAFGLLRWARLTARLQAADPAGALADAEHLEAAARGARMRHDVARRAARAFLAEGFVREAHKLFERALRYVPDDAEAVTGLARTFAAQGSPRRALELYTRALTLAERAASPTSAVAIDLAKALVDVAHDRPAAIARVRTVPADAPEAAEARLLEARWRAELGDLAGAGLAIGRLRDHAERDPLAGTAAAAPGSEAAARAEGLAALLFEAALIDERQRDDLAGAQRDLALALRLAPRNGRIGAAFRRVARAHTERAGAGASVAAAPAMPAPPRRSHAMVRGAPSPDMHGAPSPDMHRAPSPDMHRAPSPQVRPEPPPLDTLDEDENENDFTETRSPESVRAEDEALAERLSEKLRAAPHDRDVVAALCDVLERLERDLELFALLSARMDEGSDDEREWLGPRRAAVLARLARRARSAGNASEAELYEMMLAAESG